MFILIFLVLAILAIATPRISVIALATAEAEKYSMRPGFKLSMCLQQPLNPV